VNSDRADTATVDEATRGRLLRRVAGPVRPRKDVLAKVEKYIADVRPRIDPPALAFLLLPDPKKLYRWKVLLACDHVTEVMTSGPDDFPNERRYDDGLTRTPLHPGEIWCHDKAHWEEPRPYQDVVEWVSSKVIEFEADPLEPKDGWDPETWKVIRHDEPHSSRFWRVRLTCGHHYDHVVTDVDWTPERGPKKTSVKRASEMRVELEEYWAQDPDESPKEQIERAHMRKMLDLRWPLPTSEQACCTCAHARRITGYQRIEWLVPPPKPPAQPKSDRQVLQERLARAEAEADRLRRELDRLD
jgi:hypothetical protein